MGRQAPVLSRCCATDALVVRDAPLLDAAARRGATVRTSLLVIACLLAILATSVPASAQPAPPPAGKAEQPKPGEGGRPPADGSDDAGSEEGGDPPPADSDAGAGSESAGEDDAPLMGDPPPPEPPSEPPTGAGDDNPPPEATQAEETDAPAAGAEVETTPDEEEKDKTRVTGADKAQPTSEVYAEDWWNLSRPVFEIHGYYRVRSELFHNFALGRRDAVKPLWPQPPDKTFIDTNGGPRDVELCGQDPNNLEPCDNNTQAGANMRFRLEPELHISDNVRIRSQIDLLDNLVLGSTPQGYANVPGDSGGYQVAARGGYNPLGSFASTQWAPQAGVNSTKDSILVKRVWGEYSSPIGQLRFGRMPSHWGLGMFVNSGDRYDSDWQTTADRLMFLTGVRSCDLYFGAAWDFANEGPTSAVFNEQDGQPYDVAQTDDVDQWVFVVVRRLNKLKAKKLLRDGYPVFEGGAYVVYRQQEIANDTTDPAAGASLGQENTSIQNGYTRRGAQAVIPDGWFRFRYENFRFETEGAFIWGDIDNVLRVPGQLNYANNRDPDDTGWNIRQWGLAIETDYRALDDKLHVGLKFGYSSGDSDVEGLSPVGNELQPQLTPDRTFSTFRFHPDYRVDLILFRNVLTRVQGAYYFRPEVGYEFIRDPDGQKIGGDAAVIWSRASEFVQAPGNSRDLGVELNFRLYYQAKDGVLNDDLDEMGGFFTSLQYGVLFPLGGLGYLPGEVDDYRRFLAADEEDLDTATAQVIRWYLGILF